MKKLILFTMIFIAFSLTGCGNKNDETTDKKDKQELKTNPNSGKDEKKKEDANRDPQSSESSGSEDSKANELGMTPGMPANFPQDVPQPKNSKTLGSLNSSEGTVVTFESPEKVQDIVNYYKEEMKKNGYVISEGGETLVSDKGGLISWKKDNKEVGLMLGYDKDKNITSLVITYK